MAEAEPMQKLRSLGKRPNFANGKSCFLNGDCKSAKCSECPLGLKCGAPINKPCKKNDECCTLNCVGKKCKAKKGKVIY